MLAGLRHASPVLSISLCLHEPRSDEAVHVQLAPSPSPLPRGEDARARTPTFLVNQARRRSVEPMNRLSEYGLRSIRQAPASPGAQSPGLRTVSRPRPAWGLPKHQARFTGLTIFSQALERLAVRWMCCSLGVGPVSSGAVSRGCLHSAHVQFLPDRGRIRRLPMPLGTNGGHSVFQL
jgi:hypothetical protein